jgi:hypothetical protein
MLHGGIEILFPSDGDFIEGLSSGWIDRVSRLWRWDELAVDDVSFVGLYGGLALRGKRGFRESVTVMSIVGVMAASIHYTSDAIEQRIRLTANMLRFRINTQGSEGKSSGSNDLSCIATPACPPPSSPHKACSVTTAILPLMRLSLIPGALPRRSHY